MWFELLLKFFSSLTCSSPQINRPRVFSFVPEPNHSGNYAVTHRHKQIFNNTDKDAKADTTQQTQIRDRAAGESSSVQKTQI